MSKNVIRSLICLLLIALLLPVWACTKNEESESVSGTTSSQAEDVTTSEPAPDPIEIVTPTVYLMAGESYELTYKTEGTRDEAVWSSSSDCVTVENGVITAVKEGFSHISANGGNECLVYVLSDKLSTVTVKTASGQKITSRDVYVSCHVSVNSDNDEYDMKEVSANIRLRGNSTFYTPEKKSYRIKFTSKTNMLGMNEGAECKSWVLLAEWFDDTLLRDPVAYTLAPMIMDEYSSDYRFVRLKIDGKYMGVFLLAEQCQIHPERVNIEEAGEESSSLMSGYMFEVNSSDEFDPTKSFKVYHEPYEIRDLNGVLFTGAAGRDGERAHYMTLKNNKFTKNQLAFSKYYLRAVFEILYQATYNNVALEFKYDFINDPSKAQRFLSICNGDGDHMAGLTESKTKTPQEAIEAVIDIDSLVNTYIFNQIMCNADAFWRSFYFWVDLSENGSKKLVFGCPWDHDGATVTWSTFDYRAVDEYFDPRMNVWLMIPMVNDWFKELVYERWAEVYEKNNGFELIFKLIESITNTYASEFSAEQKLWNRQVAQKDQAENTYNWFKDRIAWINSEFDK